MGILNLLNRFLGKNTSSSCSDSSSTTESYRLGYRGDVEGLRAVAVLLVVLAHASVPAIQGGYIGVDVFFVLSGFLISGLLVKEMEQNGKINLLDFYARRLKRLCPALLFMVLCTSVAAFILMSPFGQVRQAYYARFAVFWISNIKLAFSKYDYFDQLEHETIFLHTWSLGVEEQFYLIWPLFILLLYTLCGRGAQSSHKRSLYIGMAVTLILGLLASVVMSYKVPLWGFYLMPSRVWQFAMGAIAYLATVESAGLGKVRPLSGLTAKTNLMLILCGWVGVLMIGIAAIHLKTNITYPGFWAIVPSLGTVLVLIAGAAPGRNNVSHVLSIKPMQWLGHVSYSWYLWHWPVLALGGNFYYNPDDKDRFILVLVSLVIATFSYKVIESPIRNSKWLSTRPKTTLFTSVVIMGIMFFAASRWHSSTVLWANHPDQQRFLEAHGDMPIIYANGCDDWYHNSDVKVCGSGQSSAQHTVLLIGDSVAAQWFPLISSIYNLPDWKVLVMTKSACPMVDEPYFYDRIKREYTECSEWRDSAIDKIKQIKPNTVYMSNGKYDFNQSQWLEGTSRVLAEISPHVGEVFIINTTNVLPFDAPECLSRQKWQENFISWGVDCSSMVDDKYGLEVYNLMISASERFNNVSVIDMNPVICPDNRCYAEREGTIVFKDSNHLTASYAKKLTKAFIDKVVTVKPQ